MLLDQDRVALKNMEALRSKTWQRSGLRQKAWQLSRKEQGNEGAPEKSKDP